MRTSACKLWTIVLVWVAAYAVNSVWLKPVQTGVDPAVAVRQLHSDEAVEELQRAGREQSPDAKSVYAVAAIVTTGICLDSVIARLSGRSHNQARPHDESACAQGATGVPPVPNGDDASFA